MNKKKKTTKRIYKQKLMSGEERAAYTLEMQTENMHRAQLSNKKIKPDILGNPMWTRWR